MGVTHRRLGDGEGGLVAEGLRPGARTDLAEQVALAGGHERRQVEGGELLARLDRLRTPLAVRLVDGDVGEPVQDLRAAILRDVAAEQLRALLDELRRDVTTGEVRDGRSAVLSGLEEGETVVAKGLLRLRAGQRVEIQDESGQEASE